MVFLGRSSWKQDFRALAEQSAVEATNCCACANEERPGKTTSLRVESAYPNMGYINTLGFYFKNRKYGFG